MKNEKRGKKCAGKFGSFHFKKKLARNVQENVVHFNVNEKLIKV